MTQALRDNTERIMSAKGYGTQAMLAERLGVTEQHLNAVLNGRKNPGRKLLERIADVLDVTVPALLTPFSGADNREGQVLGRGATRIAGLLVEVNEALLLTEGKADDETALSLAINMLTNKLKALEARTGGGQGREKDAAV